MSSVPPEQPAVGKRPWLSLFQGLRPFDRGGAARDCLAGFQLAAMNIPQALGYTRIAGTPVVTGFYTLLLPLVAFAAFGSSRYLVVAADSATAAILAGGLAGMAPLGSARYVELTSLVALLTAVLLLMARLFKLGFLADFLSRTVLIGFLTGVGLQVGIAVLGEMLGLKTTAHRTVEQLVQVVNSLQQVHLPSLGLAALVVAGVFALERFAPKVPGPLIAVVGAIAASATWDFAGRGFEVISPVAGGLPHLGLPQTTWKEVQLLLPLAASCFVMILAQSAAVARVYAERHHQTLNENTDLVGLSAANAAAAFSGTFVVNGSPTQTAMVESSGGRSQVAHLATAAVVAVVLLFLTKPLQYLPRCVLGAIVFIVAIKLVHLSDLRKIRQESPIEFWVAVATAAVVVLIGVEEGIILAMIASLLRIVQHSYHPHSAVLVKETEGGVWRLTPPVAGARSEPGLAIYRFGAPLFYANAARFSEEIHAIVGPAPSPLRWLLVDAGAITHVDYSAARVVRELQKDLIACGVTLVFARVGPDLKPDFDRHHLTEVIGPDHIYDRLHHALSAYHKLVKAAPPPASAVDEI